MHAAAIWAFCTFILLLHLKKMRDLFHSSSVASAEIVLHFRT